MKMLLEYLERAVELEKLAATEPNETFRAGGQARRRIRTTAAKPSRNFKLIAPCRRAVRACFRRCYNLLMLLRPSN
jgi:hypothetical protein